MEISSKCHCHSLFSPNRHDIRTTSYKINGKLYCFPFFLLIFAAILTSFPAGGSYLNDVVVRDAIEYDELITGKRT